jgi:hypothetical protein
LQFRYRGSSRESAVAQLFSLGILAHAMKKAKIPLIVLGSLGILALTFFIGLVCGEHYIFSQKFLTQELDRDVRLYQLAEDGNLARVKSGLGCQIYVLFSDYNQYTQFFIHENVRLANFNETRRIATITATNGDLHTFDK